MVKLANQSEFRRDKMVKVKLRIPIYIFTLGLISGIYQRFDIIIFNNYYLSSAQFLGTFLLLFFIYEYTRISEKEINIIIGLLLVGSGFLLDYLLV